MNNDNQKEMQKYKNLWLGGFGCDDISLSSLFPESEEELIAFCDKYEELRDLNKLRNHYESLRDMYIGEVHRFNGQAYLKVPGGLIYNGDVFIPFSESLPDGREYNRLSESIEKLKKSLEDS